MLAQLVGPFLPVATASWTIPTPLPQLPSLDAVLLGSAPVAGHQDRVAAPGTSGLHLHGVRYVHYSVFSDPSPPSQKTFKNNILLLP